MKTAMVEAEEAEADGHWTGGDKGIGRCRGKNTNFENFTSRTSFFNKYNLILKSRAL